MRKPTRLGAVLGVIIAVAAGVAFSNGRDYAPAAVDASSHREAPTISLEPSIDNTDFYMWVAPDAPDSVTFVMNVWPFANPSGGPNFFLFHPDAVYSFHIDNNGDAVEDIRYEFRFRTEFRNGNTFLYNTGPITSLDDPDWNIRQFYSVHRVQSGASTLLAANLPVPPDYVGEKSIPNYETLAQSAVQHLPGMAKGDGKVFAGQRDDSFFIDIGAIFDLLTIRVPPGNNRAGADGLARYTVKTMALQVPKTAVTGTSSPIIGAWTTVSRNGVQMSRLGQPLVNEVVIPLKLKDAFNSIDPSKDQVALPFVVDPILPPLIEAIYGINVPDAPREDLVTIFLKGIPNLNQPPSVVPSEMLRLNTSIPPNRNPNRLGVLGGDTAGFPNGRRPSDDVTDIALQVMAGATPLTPQFLMPPNSVLGDGVPENDKPFMDVFPYLAVPEPGSDTSGVAPASAPPTSGGGGGQKPPGRSR